MNARMRAAASSIASGRQSRRSQIVRTVPRRARRRRTTGTTARARSTKSVPRRRARAAPAARAPRPRSSAARGWWSARGARGSGRTRCSTSGAAAPTTCSQLSRTAASPGPAETRSVVRRCSSTRRRRLGLDTERSRDASGRRRRRRPARDRRAHAVRGNRRQSPRPTSIARRVLPTPPGADDRGNAVLADERRRCVELRPPGRSSAVVGAREGCSPARRRVASVAGPPPRGAARGRVVCEDRVLESLQLRARVDAQLFGQQRARALVGAQCVGLTPGAVQRRHQLTPQSLAQRVLVHQRLELADHSPCRPSSQVGLDAVLDGGRTRDSSSRVMTGRAKAASAKSTSAAPRHNVERASRSARRRPRRRPSAARRDPRPRAGRSGPRRARRAAAPARIRRPVSRCARRRAPVAVGTRAPAGCCGPGSVRRSRCPRAVGRRAPRAPAPGRDRRAACAGRETADVDGSPVVVEHLERPQDPELHRDPP